MTGPDPAVGDSIGRENETAREPGCKIHCNEAVEQRLMSRIDTQSECASETGTKKDDTSSQNSKKVLVMITITFLFFFVELTVGFMNRSIALLADSYHMLSDVMALMIAFACLRVLRKYLFPLKAVQPSVLKRKTMHRNVCVMVPLFAQK